MPADSAAFTGALNAVGINDRDRDTVGLGCDGGVHRVNHLSDATGRRTRPLVFASHEGSGVLDAVLGGNKEWIGRHMVDKYEVPLGVSGKFPLPWGVVVAFGVLLPAHASNNDDNDSPAVPIAAPLSRLRRPSRNSESSGKLFNPFTGITSNSEISIESRKPTRMPQTVTSYPSTSFLSHAIYVQSALDVVSRQHNQLLHCCFCCLLIAAANSLGNCPM